MAVDTKNSEYKYYLPQWTIIRDAVESKIKSHTQKYLPKLSGQSGDQYNGYLSRAQYVNYSSRVINIALGHLFRKKPVVENVNDDILNNIDLAGNSFSSFSRQIANELLQVGRIGVLVNYSNTMQRPYLKSFVTESIINWKTKEIDGVLTLIRVVIEGSQEVINPNDPYDNSVEKIWTDLYIDEDGRYAIDTYKKTSDISNTFIKINETQYPIFNNTFLDFIPFYFLTANGINTEINKSPLYDFIQVNLGHYKNSADYENMLHWCGAKTIVTKGFDEDVVPIGGAFNISPEGDAFFLEASSDSGLENAMRSKEAQMAALGSSLISGSGRYIQAAETARISSESEYATLADISNALSQSFKVILTVVMMWFNNNTQPITVAFNKDFEVKTIGSQELSALISAVQSGTMSLETLFYNLQKGELYPDSLTAEEEINKIKEENNSINNNNNTDDNIKL